MFQPGDSSAIIERPERRRVRGPMSLFQEFIKRGFDIAVAITGLLLLSPLVILVSLAIILDSRGPILCRNKRYGLDGSAFEVLGFRSTIAGHEDEIFNHMSNKIQCVTRVGLILRRSGIDKIPQLINILRGELSAVGPHPFATAPSKAFMLSKWHKVRPGLVSWAQVNDDQCAAANSAESVQRRIEYDRYYLENRSLLLDMKVLLRALFLKRTYL